MQKIIADISISLDGFVTGPDPDLEHGLGVGGEPLHTWAVGSDDPVDVEVLHDSTGQTGAVVMRCRPDRRRRPTPPADRSVRTLVAPRHPPDLRRVVERTASLYRSEVPMSKIAPDQCCMLRDVYGTTNADLPE